MIFDKRKVKWFFQKITKGYNDPELWSLQYYLAKYIVKRLKAFKKSNCAYPCNMTSKEWDEILDDMIWAFNYVVNDDDCGWKPANHKDEKRFNKGIKLFSEYFRGLWW